MPFSHPYSDRRFSRLWRFLPHKRITLRHAAYASSFFLCLLVLYRFAGFWDYLAPNNHLAPDWADRASQVRNSFLHAYHGYERYAAPRDELKPLSNTSIDNFNGWGVTTIDSLDTMLLMGLDAEFKRGLELVENTNFTVYQHPSVPFFETVIRYLGGLLSAYALSREPILLQKADQLANALDPAFLTESGFPAYSVNLRTGQPSAGQFGVLAEIASFQLEYTYLAKLTGNKTHFNRAKNAMEKLAQANIRPTGGLLPVGWDLTRGQPNDERLSVGAAADSGHEYLLKSYLLTAQTDKSSLEMYIRATTHILTNLLYLTTTRHLLYVTTIPWQSQPLHVFEHLSCFLPGILALGAHTLPLDRLSSIGIDLVKLSEGMDEEKAKGYKTLARYDLRRLHLWAADGLAQTCYLTYADQVSGLGPDGLSMSTSAGGEWINAMERWKNSGGRGVPPGVGVKEAVLPTDKRNVTESVGEEKARDYTFKSYVYLLRPETVESLYLMWRVTGDKRWRVYGWEIYQALETQTRTSSGYASLARVDQSPALQSDDMPSYFLAETLKYLYLLFIDDDVVPLDKWVFNTEAHPLPVFRWSAQERQAFGI